MKTHRPRKPRKHLQNQPDELGDDEKPSVCLVCQRSLEMGQEMLAVEEGVIGPRGLVPLGETKLFCDEGCLRAYLDGGVGEVVSMPPRFP